MITCIFYAKPWLAIHLVLLLTLKNSLLWIKLKSKWSISREHDNTSKPDRKPVTRRFKSPNRDKSWPGVMRAQDKFSVECTVSWSPEWISCSVFQCLISGDGDLLSKTVQAGCLSSGVYRSSKLSVTARPFYSYWCIYSISLSSSSPTRSVFVLASSSGALCYQHWLWKPSVWQLLLSSPEEQCIHYTSFKNVLFSESVFFIHVLL